MKPWEVLLIAAILFLVVLLSALVYDSARNEVIIKMREELPSDVVKFGADFEVYYEGDARNFEAAMVELRKMKLKEVQ